MRSRASATRAFRPTASASPTSSATRRGGERLPHRDLGGAARRLRGAEAVHLRRAERRLSPLVSRRALARLRLEPRRRGREEGEGTALRPAGRRRRAAAADRRQGVRRVDRLVARLAPHRLRAPRARRGVRGGGRPQAGAAPVHPRLLQARRCRLDRRPPLAPVRRRPRRRRRASADRRRLRERRSGVVARRQADRLLVDARRPLGRRVRRGALRARSRLREGPSRSD